MSHYVIGDVQGCFDELIALCKKIKFNPNKDLLIFAGDLVNRGPKSLDVIDFCLKNKKSVKSVMGNHDFYLLYLLEHKKNNKSLKEILNAKNNKNIYKWLKRLPLLLKVKIKKTKETYWISHAGIPFIWSLKKAKKLSDEMRIAIKNDSSNILMNMWGDKPSLWKDELKGYSRYRIIINYFTRMRYLDKRGALKLKKKDLKSEKNHIPWFKQTHKNLKENENIIFGHWAALEGKTKLNNIIGLDTGCVWGKKLTAIRLEDKKIFQVKKNENL
ncbi:MAG: symmetrical bis(5'-nucleosyl)-tetraphosphatase [SAR86 cluster bacterium]|uniref:bis(5'-nucleosyl)-tetraphosphatase (symmetrical) n=1 Tax=SAR86 cluster bacterium TaxID=2030880 RepID=A0A520MZV0_9GAMM|nr:MAG: symmetrical bis(5'-nucleosyl)-tetraphosphatase [SAR86 cluster bacterium]